MNQPSREGGKPKSAAPLFVASCAVGFLIISGCAAYFVLKFFL